MHRHPLGRLGRSLLLAGGWVASLALGARGQNPAIGSADGSPETVPPANYTINLSPPNVVGQKFALVTDESQKMKMQVDAYILGMSAGNEDVSAETSTHFEAEAEVLNIFPNGGIKKIALTVKILRVTVDGQTTTKLPPGAKIIAEMTEPKPRPEPQVKTTIVHGEKGRTSVVKTVVPSPPPEPPTKITVDGHAPNKELYELLEGLVALGDGKSTMQEKMGPPGPVAIGASWPIKMPDQMPFDGDGEKQSTGATIPATASARLEAVRGSGSQQVVVVSNHFLIKDFKPQLDANVPVDSLNCAATGNGSATIPAALTAGVEKIEMTVEFTFQAKGGMMGISAKVAGSGEMKSQTVKTYEQQNPASGPPSQNGETPVSAGSR